MFKVGITILLSIALSNGYGIALPERKNTGPSGITCAESGICAGKPDGTLFADPKGNGYIVCQCECGIERPCPEGTKFNQQLLTCDHIPAKPVNPVTPSPVTPSPVTPSPVTPSPVTPSPETPSPVTPSPPATGPSGITCAEPGICAGKPDGTLFADPNGNGYIVCQCECGIERPCPEGTKFNQQLLTCDHIASKPVSPVTPSPVTPSPVTPSPVTPSPVTPSPPATGPSGITCAEPGICAGKPDGTLFADPNGNGYIVCQCECGIERPCPEGTKFNQQLLTCDHIPSKPVNPVTPSPVTPSPVTPSPVTPSPVTPSPVTPLPPATGPSGITCAEPGICAGKPDGTLFADPNGNGYIVCQCECGIERPCPEGTKFNQQLLTCDHIPAKPVNPVTPSPVTPIPVTPSPVTPSPVTPSPVTPSPPATGPSGITCAEPGICAGKPDGTLFADPKGNGYIVCQCECGIERPCPQGTKFNEQLATCDHV